MSVPAEILGRHESWRNLHSTMHRISGIQCTSSYREQSKEINECCSRVLLGNFPLADCIVECDLLSNLLSCKTINDDWERTHVAVAFSNIVAQISKQATECISNYPKLCPSAYLCQITYVCIATLSSERGKRPFFVSFIPTPKNPCWKANPFPVCSFSSRSKYSRLAIVYLETGRLMQVVGKSCEKARVRLHYRSADENLHPSESFERAVTV